MGSPSRQNCLRGLTAKVLIPRRKPLVGSVALPASIDWKLPCDVTTPDSGSRAREMTKGVAGWRPVEREREGELPFPVGRAEVEGLRGGANEVAALPGATIRRK